MEKIIFNDGHEFEVMPLGIVSNDITKRRKITIKSDLDYNEILVLLSDNNNISKLTYTLENGVVIATYTDCVALKTLTYNIENNTYTMEFSTDLTERLVYDLQTKVQSLEQMIDSLTTEKNINSESDNDIQTLSE